ncbi:MAG: CRISPR-associated endonuclease Cas2 [Burkholderiales bacterium]
MRHWLISYDIADSKRRRSVERTLLAIAERVQESVFVYVGEGEEVHLLAADLRAAINVRRDGIVVCPMCRACQSEHAPEWPETPGAAYWIV